MVSKLIPEASNDAATFREAFLNRTGTLTQRAPDGAPWVMAYAPVENTDWAIVIKVEAAQLYGVVQRQVLIICAIIVLLVPLGTLGLAAKLRPLARSAMHAGDLERQIGEKTEALQRELREHEEAELARSRHMDELTRVNEEPERFNSLVAGREQRMIELKGQVNELLREAGKPPAYDLSIIETETNDRASRPASGNETLVQERLR